MSSTGALGTLNGRQYRSMRRDPPPINPVIPAAGGSDTMSVALVNYVAQCTGYDTEECIQVALEDGEIELYYRCPGGYREYDVYRFTAKGRRACDRHIREVYQRSAEAARRLAEEQRRQERGGAARHGIAAPAGKPPPPQPQSLPASTAVAA